VRLEAFLAQATDWVAPSADVRAAVFVRPRLEELLA
jgi:hypothetical protein